MFLKLTSQHWDKRDRRGGAARVALPRGDERRVEKVVLKEGSK